VRTLSLKIVAAATLLSFGSIADAQTISSSDCLNCHSDRNRLGTSIGAVSARRVYIDPDEYRSSIHNSDCAACHPGYDGAPDNQHQSRPPVASCGSCHQSEEHDWGASIHGRDALQGDLKAPNCTTCHGAHGVRRVSDPLSPVNRRNLPTTCANCHDDEEIATEYGTPRNRLETYESSYHGLAVKFGRMTAADCASCHNSHLILPPSDPRSSVNKANLPSTCGKCHPGAGEQFATGKIHVSATKESSPGMFYVRKFYTYFIAGLMILFVGYIILEHSGYARARRKKEEPK